MRAILAVLLINSLGLGLIFLRLNNLSRLTAAISKLPANLESNTQILDKLSGLQEQITRLQSPVLGAATSLPPGQLSNLLPDLSQDIVNTSNHFIIMSDNPTEPINVYKEQADFSPLVDHLLPGHKYSYSTKLNNWYLVNLDSGATGWVKSAGVTEIP